MTLSAAVLTGGRSSRMGTDKALLEINGVSLLDRIIRVLKEISSDVMIVGDRPAYSGRGARVIADRYEDAGSLGGIATAIGAANEAFTLVVACDMPFLSVSLLRDMAGVPRTYDALVPMTPQRKEGRSGITSYQPLHAIYSRSCLPHIEAAIDRGDYRIVGFFDQVDVRCLDENWVCQRDRKLLSFINTNTTDEFAIAMQAAERNEQVDSEEDT